ncbi:hypothetical protein V6N13_047910 [Hibiscus sabdariffa]
MKATAPVTSTAAAATAAASPTRIIDVLKTPKFVKTVAIVLLSVSLLFLATHLSSSSSPFSTNYSLLTPHASPPLSPPPPPPQVRRTGIIDENGAMSAEFIVEESGSNSTSSSTEFSDGNEEGSEEEEEERKSGSNDEVRIRFEKYKECEKSKVDYIPCLDNEEAIKLFSNSEKGEKYERHCPGKGKMLDCVVPRPEGYQAPIPWPQSRDEICHRSCVISVFVVIFPHTNAGGLIFAALWNFSIESIKWIIVFDFSKLYDIGIMELVTAILMKDDSYITMKLVDEDGILLLEVNRMLRAGGYFVWAAQPVYKHEEILQKQWKAQIYLKADLSTEMEDLTSRICWELVKKEGYIAIWRKPLNNSCYLNRDTGALPPLCDPDDNSDSVWYVDLRACITQLQVNGYGSNVSTWPARLHDPPGRLQSIEMDAYISRKEIFRAESKYWNEIIDSYIRAFRWKDMKLRNVMDMRAGLGGFAAALHDLQFDCWVMNVVPVSGFNTLPVIYDRGLIGVMHDWCEPFDTYPRTYDLLHASGLFSIEKKRCNMSTIMLEMDRMLRPGGRVYIRDSVYVMGELEEIATAMGWAAVVHETGEGPHASWKILISEKRNSSMFHLREYVITLY